MTAITPRERVRTAIRHIQPDRTPYQINFTTPARRKLVEHYGTADLDDLIGNHLAKYKARPPDALGWLADRPGFFRDEFGVVMKALYGDRLAFYGGVSVQQLLPHGTPQMVRDEVRRLIDEVGRDGGFIISPSHDMPGDIPVENMVALIETVREG